MSIFNYDDDDALGKVSSVDTSTVVVEVENLEQLKRLQVNRLAVLQSSRLGQHLVGLNLSGYEKEVGLRFGRY